MLLVQLMVRAFYRALLNAGNSMDANMAMMAMTTNNSINVKAERWMRGERRMETSKQ